MYFVNRMHRQAFLKLMDESDFFGLVKTNAKVNSSTGIAVFYLMTTPTILEELGVLWKLSLLELYLSETYLKRIRADLSSEGKQIIDAAISFLSKGKQLNRVRCLEEWGSLKNKRIRSALIQALSIVLDEVVLESENRMGVETSSSRTANQLKRVLTFNQIKFWEIIIGTIFTNRFTRSKHLLTRIRNMQMNNLIRSSIFCRFLS